ncbi:VWA domain-containing protein [Paenibacillus sp. J5C_2022]|uniref:vWA domain-containing protein n=1 Tax=Paenibacillus sp. J5C2022 TaxID=2977129 RepID=UPI0021D3EAB7|nr:vWA domain-containing protein [Paenibacillus sp. J5C2022]MCU6710011.1 VWA domain-containing protein [Paenibacillus sp. J5C2022]
MTLRNRFKHAAILVILSLLMLLSSLPAASASGGGSGMDAVLVLDVSHSMADSDRNKIGNEAMKMFIDMLSEEGNRVGIVAYTDQIEREKALLEIDSPEDKESLKAFIDDLNRGSYTDIAVGMKEAVQILSDGADTGREPIIIVLADGNNSLDPKSGRTEAESDREMEKAVSTAKDRDIPIYTIGLNADGTLNKDALEQLAKGTGGKSFVTSSADDLPRILSEIFASHLELNIVPVDSFTANGDYQKVKVTVPNSNVLEANISIMSDQPVEAKLADPSGNAVAIPSQNVLLAKSKSYSLIKIVRPEQGEWTLQVKGVAQDKIDINLIFNYDLTLELEPLGQKSFAKGDTINLNAFLASGGQRLGDSAQYRNMNAVMNVKDVTNGKTEQIPMKLADDYFEGSYKIPDSHDYEITVRAEEQSFFRESETIAISASSRSGSAVSKPDVDTKESGSYIGIIIAAVGAIALLAAAYFVYRMMKERSRGFVGQIVIEIRDENTGDKSSPQYKRLSHFKGKFQLHHLLQLAPEFKETDKILFKPADGDKLKMINGSACTVEKFGRAAAAGNEQELKSGDRVTITLTQVDKTIHMEYLV